MKRGTVSAVLTILRARNRAPWRNANVKNKKGGAQAPPTINLYNTGGLAARPAAWGSIAGLSK